VYIIKNGKNLDLIFFSKILIVANFSDKKFLREKTFSNFFGGLSKPVNADVKKILVLQSQVLRFKRKLFSLTE